MISDLIQFIFLENEIRKNIVSIYLRIWETFFFFFFKETLIFPRRNIWYFKISYILNISRTFQEWSQFLWLLCLLRTFLFQIYYNVVINCNLRLEEIFTLKYISEIICHFIISICILSKILKNWKYLNLKLCGKEISFLIISIV